MSDSAAAVTIRIAREDEATKIASLVRRAFESQCRVYDDWTLPPMSESAATVLDAMRQGVVLVAESNGELVGSVRGSLRDGTVHVGRLVVEPVCENRGIGRRLASEIEKHFPRAERFEIFTGHASAGPLHLYESLGYRPYRNAPVHDKLTVVYLEKRPAPAAG